MVEKTISNDGIEYVIQLHDNMESISKIAEPFGMKGHFQGLCIREKDKKKITIAISREESYAHTIDEEVFHATMGALWFNNDLKNIHDHKVEDNYAKLHSWLRQEVYHFITDYTKVPPDFNTTYDRILSRLQLNPQE